MVITVVRCKRVIMSKGWVDGWGVGMVWRREWGRGVIDEQRKKDPRPATRGVTLRGTP